MVGFAYSRKRKFYMNKRFSEVACIEENKDLWDKCTERLEELYKKLCDEEFQDPHATNYNYYISSNIFFVYFLFEVIYIHPNQHDSNVDY